MAAGFTNRRRRRGSLSDPHRPPKPPSPLVLFLCALAGLAMAAPGIFLYVPAVEGDRHVTGIGVRTEGTVERVYTEHLGRRNRTVSMAKVRYLGPEGSTETVHCRVRTWKLIGTQPPEAVIGERVTVLYDPEDGDRAVVDGWQRIYGLRGGLWLTWFFMCAFALVLAPIQGVQKFRRRRLQRHGRDVH